MVALISSPSEDSFLIAEVIRFDQFTTTTLADEKHFSDLWGNTSMGILETYITPDKIANTPIDELFALILAYYCSLHFKRDW